MAQERTTDGHRKLIMQRARLGFEHAKHLSTLSAASILLISSFLRIIFPRPLEGGLWISVGSKALIAGSFVLFGLSLLLSALAMYAFFQKLDAENLQYIKAQYQTRIGIPFVCFFVGLLWFGVAVLINFL